MKTYNVYHRIEHKFSEHSREAAKFVHAAIVQATDLDDAFRLTNHIDQDWSENEGVTVVGAEGRRSTSVGDEIEDVSTGERFAVLAIGWKKV